MNTQVKLQDIIFPVGEKYEQQFNLYYKGDERTLLADGNVAVNAKDELNFATYFNSLSIKKWKQYSNIVSYGVKLLVQGEGKVQVYGHTIALNENFRQPTEEDWENGTVDEYYLETRTLLNEETYSFTTPTEITMTIPDTDAILVSFCVTAEKDSTLCGAYYYGEIASENIKNVCLSVSTTTFKKEDFIIPNIAQLKKDLLESEPEIAENLFVHVVDNGRTLAPEDIEGYHVSLHPNPNTGGSGGYSRGMIETIRQEKKATHILLMDDDILIQPESIKRTYRLLTVLKDEYKDHFISGAMLFYEKMNVQHEDVGFVNHEGTYGPVKPIKDFYKFSDCCSNELPWDEQEYQYSGWWYCCIPMQHVREDNLPLPFFVRGDDVEYSLRNKAKFITMNGICVWHMGFTQKFNAMMELYQVHRNSLMLQAISGVCPTIDFAHRMKMFTRVELLRFNYNSAELLLEAMDDYLKGPSFLDAPEGENIIKTKGQKNEKLVPLSEFPDIEVDLKQVYKDVPLSKLKLFLYRLTYNGLYMPDCFLNKEPSVIAYDWFYAKGKQALRKKLLAVNVHEETGAMRELDKKRGKELKKRTKDTYDKYYATKDALAKEYADAMKKFTSIEFWEKYLGI